MPVTHGEFFSSRQRIDMTGTPFTGPCWSTAALGSGAGRSHENAALGEHLQRCSGSTGSTFVLRCGAEAVRAFMLARIVTTALAVVALLAGVAWLVL